MTEPASRPGPEELRRAFEVVPDVEAPSPADALAASERAVLGSAVQSPALAAEALGLLLPEHFSLNARQAVFAAVLELADNAQPVEPAAVLSELAKAGTLAAVHEPGLGSGGAYLHSLVERAGNIGYHAPKILAGWQRRETRSVLISCRQIAEAADWDPDTHLDEIRKRVEEVTAFAGTSALRPQSEVVLEVLDAAEENTGPGLTTGFRDLDDAIGGLRPGELIVIGARPGVGKSVLGLNLADHVSTELGLPVFFSSCEMRTEELTHRRIAATASVPLAGLTRHNLTDADWRQIARAQERLTASRLYVDDTPGVSLAQVRGRLRAMARTGNEAKFYVADYLGIFGAPRAESRQQAVAELARGFKLLAREFGIPVVLLAQLNRSPEARSDKKPAMADLRESGEIEAAADIVILLHREDAYERESPRAGEVDLIIPKNRQGPLCTVTLCFQGHYGRMVEMAPEAWSASRNAVDR